MGEQMMDPPAEPQPPRALMTPPRAFLLVAALMAAAALAIILSSSDGHPQHIVTDSAPSLTPSSERSPLIDAAEVKRRFKALKALELRAYREADSSGLHEIYVDSSEIQTRVEQELNRLRRDGVSDRSLHVTLSLRIEELGATEIQLIERAVVRPRFFKNGKNITVDATTEKHRIRWTLVLQNEDWLIGRALILASDVIRGGVKSS
jgi:hypothetical protein